MSDTAPLSKEQRQTLMANAVRALAMDAVEQAQSGHPGMPMGMADVATVLFSEFLKFYPDEPDWADRDRFILSAGHGSMLLYALLHLTGYRDMTLAEIKRFRQLGAITAGHPEFGHAKGIETTTGPLGQGLANSVGFALAERMLNARFGADLVDHYTYVIAGDGCLMEGISQEAISLAGHLKLSRLIVLFDDNQISIDGPTSLSTSEDHMLRFKACGWAVQRVDGHDKAAIRRAIRKAQKSDKPSLIACRTTIAFGAPTKAGTSDSHGSPLGKAEIEGARKNLNWPYAPFEVPDAIRKDWLKAGKKHRKTFLAWKERVQQSHKRVEFERVTSGELQAQAVTAIQQLKQKWAVEKPNFASRKSSGLALEALAGAVPEFIGGSADLTGSNNTKVNAHKPVIAGDYSGSYIYYGIREHGMAAAMNGIALHGGFIPFGGTFLVFTDYCRPSIRLASLMKQRVVFVMTHDSIGLGEDGPTHQPVEHLAALRAIPGLLVIRPGDATETAEAWQIALEAKEQPSVLVLSRQNLPAVRTEYVAENLSARGGYIISPAKQKAAVTLIATGSELSIAISAQKKLAERGLDAAVVSMPCTQLFDVQSESYRNTVLPQDSLKIAIEAAIPMGWEKYIGDKGHFVGMRSFGASAPAKDLYEFFGITDEAVLDVVSAALGLRSAA